MATYRQRKGNRTYVYQCENYWHSVEKKIKHRNRKYLGIEIIIDGKKKIIPPKRSISSLKITKSVQYGAVAVLYNLAKEFGIITTLDNFAPRRGLSTGDIIVPLAINHLLERETANKFSKWYEDTALVDFTEISPQKFSSQNIGEVMDTVALLGSEGIIDLCLKIFKKIKHLDKEHGSIIYDVTSTYLYTTVLPKARRGYNRDENNQPQINIALAVTRDKGLPLFYRSYEGNIPDTKTIRQLITDLQRVRYIPDGIIIDRGVTSKINLKMIHDVVPNVIGGISFTSNEAKKLAEREVSEKNEILREKGILYYEDVRTKLFGIDGRAILCFNHAELERDRLRRLKKIQKAKEICNEILLEARSKNTKKEVVGEKLKNAIVGVSDYFIIEEKDNKVGIKMSEDEMQHANRRDGKSLIFTTDMLTPAKKIIEYYYQKDVIEKVFKTFKSWIELQPVRRFAERRVDVYLFICYLAYLLLVLFKEKMKKDTWEGVEDVIEELGRIRKVTIEIGQKLISKLTVLTKEQEEIIKSLKYKKLFQDV